MLYGCCPRPPETRCKWSNRHRQTAVTEAVDELPMSRPWALSRPATPLDAHAQKLRRLAQARAITDEALHTRRQLQDTRQALQRLGGVAGRWRWLLGRDRVLAAEAQREALLDEAQTQAASLEEQLAAIDYLLGETHLTVERSPLLDEQRYAVSILVTNWNGADSLTTLLESHRAQHGARSAELIIVDHASVDHSCDLVRRWMVDLPITLLCCDRNQRYATANNLARTHARGETLVLANNDLAFDQPVLPAMVEALEAPDVGLVGALLFYPDGEGARSVKLQHAGIGFRPDARNAFMRPLNLQIMPDQNEGSKEVAAVTGALVACRSEDFDRAGGLLEDFDYGYEDVDLALTFKRQLGLKSVLLPGVAALHREFGSQSRQTEQALRNRRRRNTALFRARHQDYLQRAVLLSAQEDGPWHTEPLRVRIPELPAGTGSMPSVETGSAEAPFRLQAIAEQQQRIRQGFCGVWLLFTAETLVGFQPPRGALTVGLIAADQADAWLAHPAMMELDLLICQTGEDREKLQVASFVTSIQSSDPPRPMDPEWLHWLLGALRQARANWTVALRAGAAPDPDVVRDLGMALRQAGYTVRSETALPPGEARLFCQDLVLDLAGETATLAGPEGRRQRLETGTPASLIETLAQITGNRQGALAEES